MIERKNKSTEPYLSPQLVLALDIRRAVDPAFLRKMLLKKPFACVIIYDSQGPQSDEVFLQNSARLYADDIQNSGAALLIADNSRIAGRIKADGVHLEGDLDALKSLNKQKKEQKIVGVGNLRNRHCAMSVAENGADYLLFGKLGADKKPHAHPRNIQLAQWWAEIMEIPALIQAGSDPITFEESLKTTCEFIVVEEMIFAHDDPLEVLDKVKKKCENYSLPTGM
ncbi:thiamine-phosphate pyrophosphorylase ThiE [Bartonella australis AUST/NH1]|uniref:Thiamine-phosphate pyrophosphorylase ThiE n=1 Tax=Bartonella australis (strain Aust/NH1) TaxID=1094489 RepID=M1PEG0_BARAA|nr:thiamine phosphate synthase [Bartonella australis]AGF75011.1 thiamine-phosphate pyrophosphorylase ThiE [Bartonella australis AUST/NH1]